MILNFNQIILWSKAIFYFNYMKKFNQLPNAIVLIDFNNQVYRNHHATLKKMSPNSNGIHTGSIVGLHATLAQAINKAQSFGVGVKLVICEDRTPTRKRQLYETHPNAFKDYGKTFQYKGNRIKEDLGYNPIQICKEFVSCIPHTRIYCNGEEADDVIATYVHEHKNSTIFLYSTDKDLWQLLKFHKKLHIFLDRFHNQPDLGMLKKKFDGAKDFGKIPLHKMLRGDAGDNVKSVRNYPFKASFSAFDLCDGTIESYFYKLIELYGIESKFIEKIMNNIELILINKELVKLRVDLPIIKEKLSKPKPNTWKNLCYKYETPSLLNSSLTKIF